MRGPLLVVVQIVIALVVVGAVLPLVLVALPSAPGALAGPALAVGLLVVVFGVLRVIWPRARHE